MILFSRGLLIVPIRGALAIFLFGWVAIGCTTIRPQPMEAPPPSSLQTFSHERFDTVLATFVDAQGLVDYARLQQNPQDLEAYYRQIAAYSPDSHPELFTTAEHKLAYWINAYNAGAIKIVTTYYPIASVLEVQKPWLFFFMSDQAGFFFFRRLAFGGKTTSLYYLENKVIRERFGDPRIHFAVNCASLGCPRLPQRSFEARTLNRQLDHETRRFLAEQRNFRIDHANRTIHLSAIFEWYHEDFTQWYQAQFPELRASLLDYIALYLPPERSKALQEVRDRYTISYEPYDWGLNDQNPQPPHRNERSATGLDFCQPIDR
ncbi:MAG: DUF547 domain-containing protein [Desulfobacterales bacterium]|nr:DUF547 domain-containing protein [Desulfobacterales bacterium]MDJ0855197.1 DUF547 domain-containing protein [Desulfobacterales bacterium]